MARDQFQGFFSYAHHDASTDPDLIDAFTDALQGRVNAKFINADFEIWRDTTGLRTGDSWDNSLQEAVRSSDLLIVLLSPKWIDSAYCMKEYMEFLAVERNPGTCIVPLLIRNLADQEKYFSSEQKQTYSALSSRQYKRVLASEFLTFDAKQQTHLVEQVADDVAGILGKIRAGAAIPSNTIRPPSEFDPKAHNFHEVDVVSDSQVILDEPDSDGVRPISAYVHFLPRMYIQTAEARVEFGIRRAHLKLRDKRSGALKRITDGTGPDRAPNTYYVNSRSNAGGVTLCIDPTAGRHVLEELPLTPSKDENRLARVALATKGVDLTSLKASVSVSLNPEGVFLFGKGEGTEPSNTTLSKIAAIINIAAEKDLLSGSDTLTHDIPIQERNK
jgi:hypothetical protein